MPAIRGTDSKRKTRRRRRDLDQVHADLHDPTHLSAYKDTKAVEDLPGLGRYYCVECARWFEAEHNLLGHRRGKEHKRRVRALRDEPYTQKEAEAAAGLRTDNGRPVVAEMAIDEETQPDPAAALVTPSKQEKGQVREENDDEEYKAFFSAY